LFAESLHRLAGLLRPLAQAGGFALESGDVVLFDDLLCLYRGVSSLKE